MKKRQFTSAVILAAALPLSSCSGAAVEELIQPPRMNEQQSEIYDALKESVNGSINLKYPKSGQYRSAFVVSDLDDEETEEAFVFYELPNISDGASLRLNFLDKNDGKWVSVYDFAISGNEVESVRFESFGDTAAYIIVSCLLPNTTDKAISVMTFRNGAAEEIYSGRCGLMTIADTDGDGSNELFLAGVSDSSDGNEAVFIGSRDEGAEVLGTVEMTRIEALSEYKSISVGKCSEDGRRAVFVDYLLTDGSYGTDVIFCDNDRFSRTAYANPLTTARYVTPFTPVIYSKDADGDGIIELPTTEPFPDYEDSSVPQKTNMTIWNEVLPDDTPREKFRAFTSVRGDYMLVLPENWTARITIFVSFSDNSVSFYYWNSSSHKTGDLLLKLYSAADENRGKFESGGYIPLGRSEASGESYYAELNTESRLALTEAELKQLFVIF